MYEGLGIAPSRAERNGHGRDRADGSSRKRWECRWDRQWRHVAGLALFKAVALVERPEHLAVGAHV